MICRIHGLLEAIDTTTARLRPMVGGEPIGITLELLLTGYGASRLQPSIGSAVDLITLHYYESVNQGAMFTPRLAAFISEQERQLFLLLTSCKGIGYRKALRAMEVDPGRLAGAIADRDIALLQSLPEIGRRTAESILVSLKDRIGPLLESVPVPAARGGGDGNGDATTPGSTDATAASAPPPRRQAAREALEALVQLGESRADAMRWIDQVLDSPEPPATSTELLSRVFQLRAQG